MSDGERPKAVPTAADKNAADFEVLMRSIRTSQQFSKELADHRRRMFLAYKEAGFNDTQALDLCKSLL